MPEELPRPIAEVLLPEEMDNILERNGWAKGTVVERNEDGETGRVLGGAYIELFNGEGDADPFGGVRFLAVGENGYEESYAHATEEAAEENATVPYWYVDEYEDEDVDYGKPSP